MGGLTAACLLARKGNKVLILERNDYPGGYCSVFERGQYKFESAIHAINGLGPKGRTRSILEKCNIFHKLRLLEPDELLRLVFPNHDIVIPQKNIKALKDALIKAFPSEGIGITRILDEARRVFEESLKIDEQPPHETTSVTWKYKDVTFKEFLDSHIQDERLKAVFAQYWGYLGVPPEQMSAIYYLYMFWDYAANGAYYIEGGSETAAKLLAEEIKNCGGEILYKQEVLKFGLGDNSTFTHVVTKDGKEHHAHNFISNISTKKLFLEMVDDHDIPDYFMEKMRNWTQSASAFVLYVGLKKSIQDLGIKEYEIFINADYDVSGHYRASLDNDMRNVQLGLTIYSNLDRTACPANRSALSIFVLAGYDFWKNQNPEEYSVKKKELTKIILDRCDKLIPGFSDNIDHMDVATPLTLERYSGSYKGALYGWNQDIAHTGFRRQKAITPITNLFLAGAWTRPGGGFSSVVYSGSLAEDALNFKCSKGVKHGR